MKRTLRLKYSSSARLYAIMQSRKALKRFVAHIIQCLIHTIFYFKLQNLFFEVIEMLNPVTDLARSCKWSNRVLLSIIISKQRFHTCWIIFLERICPTCPHHALSCRNQNSQLLMQQPQNMLESQFLFLEEYGLVVLEI